MSLSVVRNKSSYGVYVWELPNGNVLGDSEGNLLNIPSVEGDLERVAKLRDAARACGYPEGRCRFLPGVGRITEAQYKQDQERIEEGLLPYGDAEAWAEDRKNARNR